MPPIPIQLSPPSKDTPFPIPRLRNSGRANIIEAQAIAERQKSFPAKRGQHTKDDQLDIEMPTLRRKLRRSTVDHLHPTPSAQSSITASGDGTNK
jgi:hypothetical protein